MSSHRLNRPSWLKSDAAAVALLVVVFLAANGQLLAGLAFEHGDGETFFAPFYSFLARMTRSGHFLLWNPFCNGGSPDFAEPQIGAFSPITLLFGLIAGPSLEAFRVYWLSLWLLGGLGMYVFARSLNAPPWGGLIAGLSLAFSGYYFGHAQHISVIYSYSFIPWILWRVKAAMITGRVWPACEAGALWGLSALAGNPAVTIPTAMFVGLVALAWLPARSDRSWRMRLQDYFRTMTLVAVVGVIVLAPVYFSFKYEVQGYSDRSEPLPREVALGGNSLTLNWLSTLVSPAIASGTRHLPGWPYVDSSYLPLYFGAVALVFAAFGLWQMPARWWAWTFALSGLLFLGIALGNTLPLRAWLYDFVPPTRFFRHPPMFRGFFIIAVITIAAAAFGIVEERLRRAETTMSTLKPLAAIGCTFAALSVIIFLWVISTLPKIPAGAQFYGAALHVAIVWLSIAGLCFLAVRRQGVRHALPAGLVLLAVIDLAYAHYTASEFAFRIALPPQIGEPKFPLIELGPAGFARASATPANQHLYLQKPVFYSYTAMLNRLHTAWAQDPLLMDAVTGPNRVWFAAEAPTVPATDETFAAFQRRVHEVERPIVVRHERASLLEPTVTSAESLKEIETASPAELVPSRVETYRANDLVLRVTCPRPGWLLLTDRWSRSWTASVNGKAVPVDGGNFLFRLVPVTEGENVVRMEFQPHWLRELVFASWLTLVIIGAGTVWRKLRKNSVRGIKSAEEQFVSCGAS